MVIQRWQSVYLLLAVFSIVLVCIRPFGLITGADNTSVQLVALDFPVFLTINILTGLLLLIDIFMFRNLRSQKLVAAVCIILEITSAVTAFLIITSGDSPWQIAWTGAPVGLVCAIICTLFARYRMSADEKLLRSYDRIR